MILLQNPHEVHGKKEDLTRLFKLACLHRPDKSSIFISYLSNYEPEEKENEKVQEIEEEKQKDEEKNNEEEIDFE